MITQANHKPTPQAPPMPTLCLTYDDRSTARHDAIAAMSHEADGYCEEPNEDDWLNWRDGLDEDC